MLVTTACGGAPRPTVSRAPAAVADTAPRAPLDYVPAAGLRWLCVAQPRRIFSDSKLKDLALRVVDRDRLDAFTQLTALDLTTLEGAAIAGYDLGTLYVTALAAPDHGAVRARFQERLTTGAIVKHPAPLLHRVSGTRGGEPRTLVSVNDRLFAFAGGDATLGRIAEAYAKRQLKSPTALAGAALAKLPPVASDALAVAYFPGPFTGAWATALGGMLGDATAVSVALRAEKPDALSITATFAGEWPDGTAASELEAAWHTLSTSSTGQLFGLDQAKNMRIVADLHHLTWSTDLPAEPLVAGLRAATVANVPEMFGEHGGTPTGGPVQPDDQRH